MFDLISLIEFNKPTSHEQTLSDSLVGFLPVGPARSGPTVVGLDYEGILFLDLTVHGTTGPQDSFSWRAIQNHRLKRSVLTVDLKGTNLPWKEEEKHRQYQKWAIAVEVCSVSHPNSFILLLFLIWEILRTYEDSQRQRGRDTHQVRNEGASAFWTHYLDNFEEEEVVCVSGHLFMNHVSYREENPEKNHRNIMSLDMSDPQQRVKMLLSMWLIEDLIWRQLARLLYYHTSWEKTKIWDFIRRCGNRTGQSDDIFWTHQTVLPDLILAFSHLVLYPHYCWWAKNRLRYYNAYARHMHEWTKHGKTFPVA